MADLSNLLGDIEESPENPFDNADDQSSHDQVPPDNETPSSSPVIYTSPHALRQHRQSQQQQQQQNSPSSLSLPSPTANPSPPPSPSSITNNNNDDNDNTPFTTEGDDPDVEGSDSEYNILKKLWIRELSSPELLPHDDEIVELNTELLQTQDAAIDELVSQAANAAQDEPRRGRRGGVDPMLTSFAASVYRMEAERVRFIMADMARVRLNKIENHPLHMREETNRMSVEEVNHLKGYGSLLEKHLRRVTLDQLPDESDYRDLEAPEMIDSPDLDQYVFCKCVETVPIDNGDDDDEGGDGGGVQEHARGSCLIARYERIRELVWDGRVELLL